MFHQVSLLNEDKPLLCFIWTGMQLDQEPSVYEWQVFLKSSSICPPMLLCNGRFDIRQWAYNDPAVRHHLPPDAKSETYELWLSENGDPKEQILGFKWNCLTEMLSYKTRPNIYHLPTIEEYLQSVGKPI